jgi:hypothetical protein
MPLTRADIEKIEPGDGPGNIFMQGTTTNAPEYLYMTANDLGRAIRWVAVRRIDGWCVYCHWASTPGGLVSDEWVAHHGDKLYGENVRRVVPCTDDAMKIYAD